MSIKYCINCGKSLNGKQTKYCSNQCQARYEHLEYIAQWKKGEVSGISGEYQLSSHIRSYLLDKVGNKCEICGWGETNPFTGRIPLEIHHKDGNYQNSYEDNLIVLCPNCHSLTDNFRSRGQGRGDRKKYYMINNCLDCGAVVANTSKRCSKCEQMRRKEEYINSLPLTREELKHLIRTKPFTHIAKEYNMSDGGIKKWCQAFGLPHTKREINMYNNAEWEQL